MKTSRIHLFGASGAGVTTLGCALATELAVPHHDTDDYFWVPTAVPYKTKRDIADRLRLMHEMFIPRADWVLSGALDSWGASLLPLFDFAVFVETPTEVRVARLTAREVTRFGHDAVGPGGWRHDDMTEFVTWASHYEDGTREGRSRIRHEAFVKTLTCPLVRVDGRGPIANNVRRLVAEISQVSCTRT